MPPERVVLEGVLDDYGCGCDNPASWLELDGENLANDDRLWPLKGKRVRITVEVIAPQAEGTGR